MIYNENESNQIIFKMYVTDSRLMKALIASEVGGFSILYKARNIKKLDINTAINEENETGKLIIKINEESETK